MKCLSLWQPWATLIATGYKKLETRSWDTNHRGPLAIHAAKRRMDSEGTRLLIQLGFSPEKSLPLGVILCTCDLLGCFATSPDSSLFEELGLLPSETELLAGDFRPGRFAWLLSDVKCLAEPIRYRGAQGLFNVDDALLGRSATAEASPAPGGGK